MHVITRKRLREFSKKYADSEVALNAWYLIVSRSTYNNLTQLRKTFPHADFVNGLIVFNIGGNKYRLNGTYCLLC